MRRFPAASRRAFKVFAFTIATLVLPSSAHAISSRTLIAPTGAAASDEFGWSVGTAGDVNGDGFADVIVEAYLNDAGGASAGRAYVYYGGPAADATADLTLTGTAASDPFVTMLGWLSEDADLASSTKRRTRSSLRTSSGGTILSATLRSSD